MNANKPDTPRSSAELIGRTDLAKVNAHAVQADEYDELPELTDAMVGRAVSGDGTKIVRRTRGRPRLETPKEQVTLRLDAGVIEGWRASGPGWQTRMNEVLRAALKKTA